MEKDPVVLGVCPQTCNFYGGGQCRRRSGVCDVYHHPATQGKKLLSYLWTQPVFVKNVDLSYRHYSGSSVFGVIRMSTEDVCVYVSTSRDVFGRLLARVKEKFDFVEAAYFCKNDGTVAAELVFKLKSFRLL